MLNLLRSVGSCRVTRSAFVNGWSVKRSRMLRGFRFSLSTAWARKQLDNTLTLCMGQGTHLHAEHITSGLNSHNMCVLVEHLVGDRAVELP